MVAIAVGLLDPAVAGSRGSQDGYSRRGTQHATGGIFLGAMMKTPAAAHQHETRLHTEQDETNGKRPVGTPTGCVLPFSNQKRGGDVVPPPPVCSTLPNIAPKPRRIRSRATERPLDTGSFDG